MSLTLARFVACPYTGEARGPELGEPLGTPTVVEHVTTASILRCDSDRPPQQGKGLGNRIGQPHLSTGTSLELICANRCFRRPSFALTTLAPRMDIE